MEHLYGFIDQMFSCHLSVEEEAKQSKQEKEMAVNIAGLRRNIKNVAHNYTDAQVCSWNRHPKVTHHNTSLQVKVREATSNDPWGPSSTMMSEIADLTYNVVAFSEIMQMIWKRLNDQGKNWRHVYKALVLLEYLIKTGSEKVGFCWTSYLWVVLTYMCDCRWLSNARKTSLPFKR